MCGDGWTLTFLCTLKSLVIFFFVFVEAAIDLVAEVADSTECLVMLHCHEGLMFVVK